MKKLIISFVMFLLIAPMLSSCALLDKLRSKANPHTEMLITLPEVDKEILEVPQVTEDIKG